MTVRMCQGITQHGDAPPSIDPELRPTLSFIEYRISAIEDVAGRIVPGAQCTAHAPDPEEDAFESIIDSLAECPDVSAVSCHARPDDEPWPRASCSRRLGEHRAPSAGCPFRHAPDGGRYASTFTLRDATKRLRAASERLRERGNRLLVENTYETPALMKRILESVPAAEFTQDVRHSLIHASIPGEFIAALGERLGRLHLHDNHGGDSERFHDEHLPPGEGLVDRIRFANTLKAVGFSGTATFECIPDAGWVREWLGEWGRRRGRPRSVPAFAAGEGDRGVSDESAGQSIGVVRPFGAGDREVSCARVCRRVSNGPVRLIQFREAIRR